MWDILKDIEECRETIEILEDSLEEVGHHDHDIRTELSEEQNRLNTLLNALLKILKDRR